MVELRNLSRILAALTVVIIAIICLATRQAEKSASPGNTALLPKGSGSDASTKDPSTIDPSPSAPAPDAAAPPPRPQREAARIAAKLAMANPLIPSDTVPVPAARRVSDVIPEAAPDFDKIGLMFRDYRSMTGENPVGSNAEIMKALTGDNPKGAKLGPPEGQQLNGEGELIDRWGTPYFFHQLTSDRMEIRSAGPDRILWNEDDLTGE